MKFTGFTVTVMAELGWPPSGQTAVLSCLLNLTDFRQRDGKIKNSIQVSSESILLHPLSSYSLLLYACHTLFPTAYFISTSLLLLCFTNSCIAKKITWLFSHICINTVILLLSILSLESIFRLNFMPTPTAYNLKSHAFLFSLSQKYTCVVSPVMVEMHVHEV